MQWKWVFCLFATGLYLFLPERQGRLLFHGEGTREMKGNEKTGVWERMGSQVEESTLEKKWFLPSLEGSLRKTLTEKWVGVGEKFPWKELKEIRSLAKVEIKHGSGDFHRMEMILKNHGEKDRLRLRMKKKICRSLEAYLIYWEEWWASFEPDLTLNQHAIQML